MATLNAVVERGCTMLVHFDKGVSASEIKEALETGGEHEKADALKKAIAILLSGEQMPQLFITVIRYVLTTDSKLVQKLLLLYIEIIEKTDSAGKLLPEMILICQNLRNNLQHPNEFLRGSTLRFLCRITEPEIIEPLIPSILACLEHRHAFVRRNAVLAIDRIYQLPGGDLLLQDAPETIERFLEQEADLSARRNAFLMLYNNAQDRAVSFLMANLEQVANWGDILQNVVLDLIRKVRDGDESASRPPSRSRARSVFHLHRRRANIPRDVERARGRVAARAIDRDARSIATRQRARSRRRALAATRAREVERTRRRRGPRDVPRPPPPSSLKIERASERKKNANETK